MFKTKMMQNVSDILGMTGCGSSKEMKELVTKRVPGGVCAAYLSPLRGLLNSLPIFPTAHAVGCILSPLRGLAGGSTRALKAKPSCEAHCSALTCGETGNGGTKLEQAAADEVDDLQFIAVVEGGLGPAIARRDIAVQLNRYTISLHSELFNQRG